MVWLQIGILSLAFCQASEATNSCRDQFKVYQEISESFQRSCEKRSTTLAQYSDKLKNYTREKIYRGGVVNEELTFESAIKFLLRANPILVGNGVGKNARSRVNAFQKYNQRVKEPNVFKNFFRDHIGGDTAGYWKSLLMSWSKVANMPLTFTSEHYLYYYDEVATHGYGVLVEGMMPIHAVDSKKMNEEYRTPYLPSEAEVAVPVIYDTEMIQQVIFWKYTKNPGDPHVYTGFSKSEDAMAIQIKRTGLNTYILNEGVGVPKKTTTLDDNIVVFSSYQLKIRDDGSYKLTPISYLEILDL